MEPALALLELDSVTCGIVAGDAMAKRAPISVLRAGTVHPGRYLVLVAGEVADVEEALEAGLDAVGSTPLDQVFLPHVHPAIPRALTEGTAPGEVEALGILETATVAVLLGAVDRALKEAGVDLFELRLADDLGGKSYALLSGELTDVEAALEAAGIAGGKIIPRLHEEMTQNLRASGEFRTRLRGAS